jgi:hypothetical protein
LLFCPIIFHILKTNIMGVFLHIGFVAKATAEIPKALSKGEINDALEEYYSEDTFDCTVSKNKMTWTLKPQVIEKELAEFAETFYTDYFGDTNRRGIEKTLTFIRGIATSPNWLKRAKDEENYNFSVNDYGCDESFDVGKKHEIHLNTSTITLGYEGKFLMEEDECTLRFLETCAQKAFANFKLGKTIRAFVY